ncbi:MAG: hypothetical protein ACMG6E_08720 [Candidatus Roizmanbacteria bacterium]
MEQHKQVRVPKLVVIKQLIILRSDERKEEQCRGVALQRQRLLDASAIIILESRHEPVIEQPDQYL